MSAGRAESSTRRTESTHTITSRGTTGTARPCGPPPHLEAVRSALARLRRDLDAYTPPLTDRTVAERELATLTAAVDTGRPDRAVLRQGLLLLASSVGSVRVLAPALAALREAIDLFGTGYPVGLPGVSAVPAPRRGPGRG